MGRVSESAELDMTAYHRALNRKRRVQAEICRTRSRMPDALARSLTAKGSGAGA